jgi:diguanylate cyclase (GGDEF)-like protein
MDTAMKSVETPLVRRVLRAWSCTDFATPELRDYAAPVIGKETRDGVVLLSQIALLFLALATMLSACSGLGSGYTYTYSLLALLALHIRVSSTRVPDLRAQYLLAMLLLIVCGSALVLLAHRSGQLNAVLLLSVGVLIMLVPVVPWGLREALLTNGAIYAVFTISTMFGQTRFARRDLWLLQCMMLVAALITLVLVARALALRKHDLAMRFHLEQAKRELTDLADHDHLTGAWNRRHMEREFDHLLAHCQARGLESYFGLFDIDRFKAINDTLGHSRGDAVLRAVRAAFRSVCGADDYLARLGGDEFALLMCGPDARERIERALASVAQHMDEPLPREFRPTASLGLVRLPAHGGFDFDHAYKLADHLLYEVKRAGGNAVRCNPGAKVCA